MYCQKCRTPLKLHGSLENLNAASFHLLADQNTPQPDDTPITARLPYSQQQKDLYNQAAKSSSNKEHGSGPQDNDAPSAPSSPTAGRDRGAMSFINITDSQVVAPSIAHKANSQGTRSSRSNSSRANGAQKPRSDEDGRLSRKMETSNNLFDILSSRSDIDHPVCTECSDALIEQMEAKLAAASKERDAYVEFLRNVHADAPTAEEAEATRQELATTKKREEAALQELEELEKEKAALEAELAELEVESTALDAEEAQFWRESNALSSTLAAFQAERDSVNLRYDHDAKLLERLQRTDVYTDTFHISHDGSFGTINGLRLGRLSKQEVEWSEVNAAWGMALLLLDTLAERLSFTFKGYRLHPLGSTSKIEKLPTPDDRGSSSPTTTRSAHSDASGGSMTGRPGELLPLHRSDTPLNLTWMHKGFDAAMVAFLECMRQLGRHLERGAAAARAHAPTTTTPEVKLPYEIARDRINDCSIKSMGFGNDENWTKACKHTLTYCKFLMAYTRDVRLVKGADGPP